MPARDADSGKKCDSEGNDRHQAPSASTSPGSFLLFGNPVLQFPPPLCSALDRHEQGRLDQSAKLVVPCPADQRLTRCDGLIARAGRDGNGNGGKGAEKGLFIDGSRTSGRMLVPNCLNWLRDRFWSSGKAVRSILVQCHLSLILY